MNKPQTEGRVNHVCTEEHRRSTLFSIKLKRSTIVSLSKVIFDYYYVELDHQRSAANTSVNKMRLEYLCCLTYLIIAGLCHILSLYFTVLIHFDEYESVFCEWDELIHIHI